MYKYNSAYSQAAAGGATMFGKVGSSIRKAATGETPYDAMQRQYDNIKEEYDRVKRQQENRGALYDHLVGEGVKKRADVALNTAGNTKTFGNTTFTEEFTYDEFTNAWSSAKTNGLEEFTVGGATLLTNGSAVKFADSKMQEELGNIFYSTMTETNDIERVRLLAADAEIELPANGLTIYWCN